MNPRRPPRPESEVVLGTGATFMADIAGLPRVLRHAILALEDSVAAAVSAEIAVWAPSLTADAERWRQDPAAPTRDALSGRLDGMGSERDAPALHDLANVVRLASMTVGEARERPLEALGIARALDEGKRVAGRAGASADLLATAEQLCIGWLALAAGLREAPIVPDRSAHMWAHETGVDLTEAVDAYAGIGVPGGWTGTPDTVEVPDGHVIVCPAFAVGRPVPSGEAGLAACPLPLVATPDIASVRKVLVREYPYALEAVDSLLSPLVGTRFLHLPPTLLVGPPGSGKSRLVRRASELLGVGLWRTDAARSDNSSFGGCDRRWSTAECCHPFQAVARTRVANPFVLVDELDKAGVGRGNGRLWDALHGFLEGETSRSYPDPCLLVDLDLSHVSYLMTCNDMGSLPASLLDRCRVVQIPAPTSRHLPALLPSLVEAFAREQGLHGAWIEPLSAEERAMVARRWRGGSVRHLARIVSAILRGRIDNHPIH